jgi:hypothetical protein
VFARAAHALRDGRRTDGPLIERPRALAAAGTHVALNGFGDKAWIRGIVLPVDGGWTAQ